MEAEYSALLADLDSQGPDTTFTSTVGVDGDVAWTTQRVEMEDEIIRLHVEGERLKLELNKKEVELKQHEEAKKAELAQQNRMFKAGLEKLKAAADSDKKKLEEDFTQKLDKLKREKTKLQEYVDTKMATLRETEHHNRKLIENNRTLEQDLRDKQHTIQNGMGKLEKLHNELSVMTQSHESKSKQLQDLNVQMEQYKLEWVAKKVELERTLGEKEDTIAALYQELEASREMFKAGMDEMTGELEGLKKDANHRDNLLAEMQQLLVKMEEKQLKGGHQFLAILANFEDMGIMSKQMRELLPDSKKTGGRPKAPTSSFVQQTAYHIVHVVNPHDPLHCLCGKDFESEAKAHSHVKRHEKANMHNNQSILQVTKRQRVDTENDCDDDTGGSPHKMPMLDREIDDEKEISSTAHGICETVSSLEDGEVV